MAPNLQRRAKKRILSASKWVALTILAAVIAVPVTLSLTGLFNDGGESSGSPGAVQPDRGEKAPATRDPFDGDTQTGYGPPRPTFRCPRPSQCPGPAYVTFNSYYNTPNYGDERSFFDVKRASDRPDAPWHDTLHIQASTTLSMRAYIDNDTYRSLPGKETDAIDTRLRLELPRGPVYEAHPTAYLSAENAKPRVIWDTAYLYASRPMRLAYVPGSTEITRRKDGKGFVTEPAPNGVETAQGMDLGRWKADFVNSALVTFRVRVSFLAEPVRDPRATWQAYEIPTVMLSAATSGPLREPKIDSSVGARFSCGRSSCTGPPYVELNAYRKHPLLGDEADFLRAEPEGTYGETGENRYASAVQVRPGDRLNVLVVLDNGADPDAIGAPPPDRLVARDIRVRVMLPAGPADSQSIVAFVDSSNADPAQIADSLPIRSDRPLRIRAVPGSASIATNRGSKSVGQGLFVLSGKAAGARGWGVGVPDIPPSFSRVTYLGFTIVAWPA